ncbi:MAG: hypothetical protein Q4B71_00430 [Cardiobacteriaceae bacterium]|nr:hypothetical protein [Cardiobacteriaceae bacterium]
MIKNAPSLKALTTNLDANLDTNDGSLDDLIAETGKSALEILSFCLSDDEVESCREDLFAAMMARPFRIWGEGVDEVTINRLYRIMQSALPVFIDLAIVSKLYGYAVAEYVYRQDADGFLSLKQVHSKDGLLDRYQPKADGLWYQGDNGEELLDQQLKFLLLTHKATPSRPKGEISIIRLYPAVQLRKRVMAYAGQFVRRYAQPYVVGKQAGFAPLTDFVKQLFGFSNGGAAAIGKDDEITLHQLQGDGEAFAKLERIANARIQKLLLGRVKTSDLQNASRAAQTVEEATRNERIGGYLLMLSNAMQHAIDAMLRVNQLYGKPIHAPQGVWFEFQTPAAVDIARAERDAIYLQNGVTLTREYYQNMVGLEESHFEINASSGLD